MLTFFFCVFLLSALFFLSLFFFFLLRFLAFFFPSGRPPSCFPGNAEGNDQCCYGYWIKAKDRMGADVTTSSLFFFLYFIHTRIWNKEREKREEGRDKAAETGNCGPATWLFFFFAFHGLHHCEGRSFLQKWGVFAAWFSPSLFSRFRCCFFFPLFAFREMLVHEKRERKQVSKTWW